MLATIDDVKRALKRSDDTDSAFEDELALSLEAAEDFVLGLLGRHFGETGSVTESFYAVRPGDIIVVGHPTPIVTSVLTYMRGSLVGSPQTEGYGYHVMNRGRVRTSRIGYSPYDGLRPEERGIGALGVYDRVDVTYTAAGAVPASVRDAVALIAAAFFQTSTSEIDSSLSGEHLGDYSYTRGAGSGSTITAADRIPLRARQLLAQYMKPQARSV